MLVASALRAATRSVSHRGGGLLGSGACLSGSHRLVCRDCEPNGGASGDLVPQAMCRQEIVGEGVPQCHRLDLDQAAHRHEPEAVVLEMTIEPLDELAEAIDLLTGLRCHPAAPFLDAVGFARPLALAVGQRPRADVVALG